MLRAAPRRDRRDFGRRSRCTACTAEIFVRACGCAQATREYQGVRRQIVTGRPAEGHAGRSDGGRRVACGGLERATMAAVPGGHSVTARAVSGGRFSPRSRALRLAAARPPARQLRMPGGSRKPCVFYYDRDADVNLIKDPKVGRHRLWQPGPRPCARTCRDSGVKDVAHRAAGPKPALGREGQQGPGFKVMNPTEAAKWADVIMVLHPGRAAGGAVARRPEGQHEAGRGDRLRPRPQHPLQADRGRGRTWTCS